MNRAPIAIDQASTFDFAKAIAMSRDLKILLFNAFVVGGIGGYAVTRWGTAGAMGAVALALLLGVVRRRGRK